MVLNNPLRYTDPSGHCASDSSQGDSWCRPEEQHHKNQQLGVLATHDFAIQIRDQVNAGTLSSVIGLGQIVDFAWNFVKKDITDLMWVLSNVLLGIDPDYVSPISRPFNDALNKVGIPAYSHDENPYWVGEHFLPDNDWYAGFQDHGDQQVVHVFYYILTSFYSGKFISHIGNIYHDPPRIAKSLGLRCIPILCKNPTNEDWNLGAAGASYGAWLHGAANNPQALTVSPGSLLVEVLSRGRTMVSTESGTTFIGVPDWLESK
jgi:hypothetical protein